MDNPRINDPISRCLDAFGEVIGIGERQPWGYGTGLDRNRISANVHIGPQSSGRQVFDIQLTREWVKVEFDPSRVSLNQASDLSKSIQDAAESMGWPSHDWKWDEAYASTVEEAEASKLGEVPPLGLRSGDGEYEHSWQWAFEHLMDSISHSYPGLVRSAEISDDGAVLILRRDAPSDTQKLLDDFGTEHGISVTVVVMGSPERNFSVTDEEQQRRLREVIGLPDPFVVQYGVVFTGPPTVMRHPKSEDHVYTLEEVCAAILKAGYGGLRGRNGEWLCGS